MEERKGKNIKLGNTEHNSILLRENIRFPVYDDIRNVENAVEGMRVQLTGEVQEPAGEWWYHNDHWYAGTRNAIPMPQNQIENNDHVMIQDWVLPENVEIDIWTYQINEINDELNGLYIDIYEEMNDTVHFEVHAADYNGVVQFGNPHDVIGENEGRYQIRARNESGGNKRVTGFIEISFQSVID